MAVVTEPHRFIPWSLGASAFLMMLCLLVFVRGGLAEEPGGELREVFTVEGNFTAVTSGDVDGDGQTRIVAASFERADLQAEARIYTLTGALLRSVPLEAMAKCLALAQLDGDPQKELVAIQTGRRGRTMLLKALVACDGDGSVLWTHEARGGVSDLAVADTDGDGIDEVAAASAKGLELLGADGEVRWHNAGVGQLLAVAAGDLQADGSMEVVVPGPSGQKPLVHRLDGQGRAAGQYPVPWTVLFLRVADLVAEAPGPEVIISGGADDASEVGIVAMGGDGSQLWKAQLPPDPWAAPDQFAVAAGHLAALSMGGDLSVFTERGALVAQKARARERGLMLATPALGAVSTASDRPLILLASDQGLVGYSLTQR